MKRLVPATLRRRLGRLRAHARRQRVFTSIYETQGWGSAESASGTGSTLEQTVVVRRALPELLRELDAQVLVDVPCGDWHWLQHVELPLESYIGLDVVPQVIENNLRNHGKPGRSFRVLDVTRVPPPPADVVLCRDLLVHLSDAEVRAALRNIKASGSTWLLTTTFTEDRANIDIPTGSWRPLNLRLHPWGFPEPARLINEHCTVEGGKWLDKCLGLWRIADIPLGG